MKKRPPPFTMREMQRLISQPWFPLMATSCVAGFVLSILAPYGTHSFALPVRLTYWIGLCMAGGLGAVAADCCVKPYAPQTKPVLSWLARSVGATVSVFLCLLGLTVYLQGWPGTQFYLTVPFYVWVISALISGVDYLRHTGKTPDDTLRSPRLYDRLKPKLRKADLYALTAEDHYVRVITAAGEDLILMRLSDAITETAPLSGMSVHRSWWVAEQGVTDVKRVDGKTRLTLHSGHTVPVSRTYQKAVKDAGWG